MPTGASTAREAPSDHSCGPFLGSWTLLRPVSSVLPGSFSLLHVLGGGPEFRGHFFDLHALVFHLGWAGEHTGSTLWPLRGVTADHIRVSGVLRGQRVSRTGLAALGTVAPPDLAGQTPQRQPEATACEVLSSGPWAHPHDLMTS